MLRVTNQLSSPSHSDAIMWNATISDIDDFRNKIYSTAYSMYTVFGLTGNIFALYILIKTHSQKSSFHIYMLNLVISDLLFIVTLPFRVVYYMGRGQWPFGDFFCRVSSYSFYVNLYCSIFILTAMSITRFLAIVHPLKHLKHVSVNGAIKVCVGIWIFVTLTSSPFLINGQKLDPTSNLTKCLDNASFPKMLILNYISLAFGFIGPFLIILVCYTLIIRTLLENSMKKRQASRKKAVWMIVIVLVVFFVSFMPYHIQRTVHLHSIQHEYMDMLRLQKSVVVCLALAASNCCLNPLLYFFSGDIFLKRLTTLRKQSDLSVMPEDGRK